MNEKMVAEYAEAKTMQAIGMTTFPEIGYVADNLKMLDVAVPRLSDNEVAIRLSASAMHIDEIYAAQGTALGRFYGPKAISDSNPFLLGSSVSGTIVAVGEKTSGFYVGDDVVVIPNEQPETGSWATYRCIDEKWIMRKSDDLSHVEAAATTMASCVAWAAIQFGRVSAGSRCLVIGASGSVGAMVLQYLKSLDCQVTAVCSGSSEALVRQLGADDVVDYTVNNFSDAAVVGSQKYDAVFDCVGGREIERRAFRILKNSGVFVTVVGPVKYVGERKLSWLEFSKVMSHILWRIVSTWIGRGPQYKFGAKYPRLVIKEAIEHLVTHNIRTPVERVIRFELGDIVDAVSLLTSHRAKGRIVIDFGSS